jgi:hypothetical protein
MKNIILSFLILSYCTCNYGQINTTKGGILSQEYSKEITEYKIKEFIVREVLQVPDKQVIDVEINSLTASKSGELTIVIYNCNALKQRGLVFGFWSEYSN